MEPTVKLKPLFNEIAAAIHEKDGLSDAIHAYDFPDRIRSLATGGSENPTHVFGVCWHYGNASPELIRLTPDNDPYHLVTKEALGNPHPAVGEGGGGKAYGFSPFDEYMPWSGMEEYNIVNGEVKYKKGRDTQFSRTSYDTFVYIPAFHFRVIDDATAEKRYWYVSSNSFDGSQVHPGSDTYVAKYIANYTSNTLFSKSGTTPNNEQTRYWFANSANKKGNYFRLIDYKTYCAVQILYLVEFADFSSQKIIGSGAKELTSSGETDYIDYHTGVDGTTNQIKYRNIEALWGTLEEICDGVVEYNGNVYLFNSKDDYSSDSPADVGIEISSIPLEHGFQTALNHNSDVSWAFIPKTVGGSGSTYITDYTYVNSSGHRIGVFGYHGNSTNAGMFCLSFYYSKTDKHVNLGSRLIYREE